MSNEKVTGKVQKVDERETSYGTMYNLVVNGTTYGAGKYAPKAEAGDYVTFEAEQKGRYFNIVPKTLKKIAEPENVKESTTAERISSKGNGSSYDEREASRQANITRQASRNTAVAFLAILAGQDALPIAKSAKPADKFEALTGILDKLTEDFVDYASGKTKKIVGESGGADEVEGEPEETWG